MKDETLKKSNITIWPDNYIYISHLGDDGEYLILPTFPDSIQDSISSDFSSTTALSRSAPVYTYSNSGPRQMQIKLNLHRDLMDEVNFGISNIKLDDGEDYVDTLIKKLQAIALPKYNLQNKAVEPPLVAIRFSDEIFIKGIVNGGVTVAYEKPLIKSYSGGTKYVNVTVSFQVYEVDPYDASTVAKNGSFRGMTRGMRKGFNLEPEN